MGHHIGSNHTWNWQNDHQGWWCTHALELGIGLGGMRRFKNKLNLSIFWMSRNQKDSKCCHASLGLIKNKISNSNTNTQLTTTPHHGEISWTNWAPNCPAVRPLRGFVNERCTINCRYKGTLTIWWTINYDTGSVTQNWTTLIELVTLMHCTWGVAKNHSIPTGTGETTRSLKYGTVEYKKC